MLPTAPTYGLPKRVDVTGAWVDVTGSSVDVTQSRARKEARQRTAAPSSRDGRCYGILGYVTGSKIDLTWYDGYRRRAGATTKPSVHLLAQVVYVGSAVDTFGSLMELSLDGVALAAPAGPLTVRSQVDVTGSRIDVTGSYVNVTSFYGPSCADNGKNALDTPKTGSYVIL
eukprot:1184805-Prorocentrum_minimum.AAC.2